MRFRLLVMVALLAAKASASNVSNEVTASTTQATDANPRSGGISDSFNASLDLSEQWALNFGASLTAEGQTPAAERGAFASPSSAVTSFSLGFDWQANDSWSLGVTGDFSPQSTQFAGTQVQVNAAGTQANALLRSISSSQDLGFDLSYDTAGDSNLEWSFGGSVTTTHLDTDQEITRVRTAAGVVATTQQIRDFCNAHKCTRALLAALRPQTGVTLSSQKLSANVTAVVSRDTDLTLSGAYYVYDEDPATVGYFSVAGIGRMGNGLNIAPLQFSVRPEATHRFGGFSARLWVQAGEYVSGAGGTTASAGLKLQYKFTKTFRAWVTGTAQRDVDEQSNVTRSGSLALGAAYRF